MPPRAVPPQAVAPRHQAQHIVGPGRAVGLGLLSGLLQALCLPTADLAWLAWICLLPVLLPVLRSGSSWTPKRVFLAGFVAGVGAGAGRVYWIAETLGRYGGLGPVEAVSTTLLLVLYLAVYPAAFLVLWHRWRSAGAGLVWLGAALWTVLDWVQSWMISGFPWMTLGVTQVGTPPVAQLAALTGVHGLTFLVVLVNTSLAHVLATAHRRALVLGGVTAAVAASVAYGTHRLSALAAEVTDAKPLRIGVVQGNVAQDVKWEPGWQNSTTRRYLELTRQLAATGSHDLIVWPETALPFRLDGPVYTAQRRAVSNLAREFSVPLLVGSLASRAPSGAAGLYNRSYLIDSDGEISGQADKVHLVPFGEYLPFPEIFSYLGGLTAQSGTFDAGETHPILRLPGPTPAPFGVFICYESIFPGIARRLAGSGALFLINTTNDAWFGTTAAPYQHFAMVALRAIETGRTVVRAANTGISGAIDANGRRRELTPLFATRVLTLPVQPRTELTPYVRFGDVIVLFSAGLLCIAAAWFVRRRRRHVLEEIAQAQAELEGLYAEPGRLQRPLILLPGYNSPPEILSPLYGHLHRAFDNAAERVRFVDLRRDLSLERLTRDVEVSLPTGPCDLVGHSLGGLVAAGVALRAGRGPSCRVFALASPFGGSWLARGAAWLRYPLPALLADLRPGSSALATLRRRLGQLPHLCVLRLTGDPVRSGLPTVDRAYAVPLFLPPMRRHRAVHVDPRVIRDVILALHAPIPCEAPEENEKEGR